MNRAVFVKEIRPEKNEVVLASLQALEKTEMFLKDWNIVNRERLLGHADIIVKIRYRKQENHCTVTVTPDNFLHVQLHEPLTAIASGRALAFGYSGVDTSCKLGIQKSPTVHIMYTVGYFLSYNDLICSDNFIRCSAPALTLYIRVYCLIWALCAVHLLFPSLPASHGTIPDAQR